MASAEASSAPLYVAVGNKLLDGAEETSSHGPPGLYEKAGAVRGSNSASRDTSAEGTNVTKHKRELRSDGTVSTAVDAKGSEAESDDEVSPVSYGANYMDLGFMRSGYMQGCMDGSMFPDAQQWPNYGIDDASFDMSSVGVEPYSSVPGSLVEQLISMNAQLLAQNQLLWKSSLGRPWPHNSVNAELLGARSGNSAQVRTKVKPAGKGGTKVKEEVPLEQRTTMMLRNLPNNFTRDMLKRMLDDSGFFGLYNFLYLPIDFQSKAALGYAFVNLLDSADVQHFWKTFQGYSTWPLPSKKVCKVSWSDPHQGWQSQVDLYRDSPVMHESVPDEYRPICLADGVRVPFPEPSKPPRAPRFRRSGGHNAQRRAARPSA